MVQIVVFCWFYYIYIMSVIHLHKFFCFLVNNVCFFHFNTHCTEILLDILNSVIYLIFNATLQIFFVTYNYILFWEMKIIFVYKFMWKSNIKFHCDADIEILINFVWINSQSYFQVFHAKWKFWLSIKTIPRKYEEIWCIFCDINWHGYIYKETRSYLNHESSAVIY